MLHGSFWFPCKTENTRFFDVRSIFIFVRQTVQMCLISPLKITLNVRLLPVYWSEIRKKPYLNRSNRIKYIKCISSSVDKIYFESLRPLTHWPVTRSEIRKPIHNFQIILKYALLKLSYKLGECSDPSTWRGVTTLNFQAYY